MKRQDKDIEYQSVILERENKDLKGRLRISGDTITFQKKVGLISKKFEIEFQTTMESIKKIDKEGYSKILITEVDSDFTINFVLDTPVEANEICEMINNKINKLIQDTEEKKQDERDQIINQANYSTYIFDVTFKLWTVMNLLFIIMKETINNNWDEVDQRVEEFKETASELDDNKVSMGNDVKSIITAIKSRDDITIINSIKGIIRTLGESLQIPVRYNEWREIETETKPGWGNLKFFYLYAVSIFESYYL